jgi:hypothetical protein
LADTQRREISQPNGAVRQNGNHQSVPDKTSLREVGQLRARLSPTDQLETKCLKSVGWNNAMILWPRPSFVSKICFDLPQPRQIPARSEQADNSPNSRNVYQSRYGADTLIELLDKGANGDWIYMFANSSIRIIQGIRRQKSMR